MFQAKKFMIHSVYFVINPNSYPWEINTLGLERYPETNKSHLTSSTTLGKVYKTRHAVMHLGTSKREGAVRALKLRDTYRNRNIEVVVCIMFMLEYIS